MTLFAESRHIHDRIDLCLYAIEFSVMYRRTPDFLVAFPQGKDESTVCRCSLTRRWWRGFEAEPDWLVKGEL